MPGGRRSPRERIGTPTTRSAPACIARGPDAVPDFLRQVEQTPMFAAALAGRAVLTRAFGFDIDGGEIVAT